MSSSSRSATTSSQQANQPRFLSRGHTYRAVVGDTLVLPCEVENIGNYYTTVFTKNFGTFSVGKVGKISKLKKKNQPKDGEEKNDSQWNITSNLYENYIFCVNDLTGGERGCWMKSVVGMGNEVYVNF